MVMRELRFSKKVIDLHKSYAVIIPKDVAQKMELRAGEIIEVIVKKIEE